MQCLMWIIVDVMSTASMFLVQLKNQARLFQLTLKTDFVYCIEQVKHNCKK